MHNNILNVLSEIVTNDYVLIDVPHYNSNVGDALLWQTTKKIISNINHKCLYECSIRTFTPLIMRQKVKDDTIILFHPGGNFGDIWKEHQMFRHQVLSLFPNNPVVQLPQSVWFDDKDFMREDIELFRNHRGPVTICLRERQSYNIIRDNYPFVNALLLPDMALSFDIDKYCRRHLIKRHKGDGVLLFARKDLERKETPLLTQLKDRNCFCSDWPCMEKPLFMETLVKKILYTSRRLGKRTQNRMTAFCYSRILRPLYIRRGIKFIDKYKTVYSTRLHAAIIATLLGKDVHLLDNSYGKCFSVYDTWMKELPNISKES